MDITKFIASHREALLISDYNAYRAQLSRQLRATRKTLGRATNKREKFAKREITAADISSNHEFAHLLLLTSERAYAHAMHIKTSHAEDRKGIAGTTRSHLISRLHKAAKIASELVGLLKESGSGDRDVIEARAYHGSLAGAEAFEKQSGEQAVKEDTEKQEGWTRCLKHFSEARVIYAALYEKEGNEIFKDLLENTIDPTIRYAAYQAHISRTIPIPSVAKRYFPSEDKQLVASVEKLDPFALKEKPVAKTDEASDSSPQEVPSNITWRGRKANIVDASIGQALASVNAAEAKLKAYLSSNPDASARDKAAAYDDILIASQDVSDATKNATDELEKERVDEGDSRMQNLRVTSLAVNYDLVSWRVGRNRILIGDNDGMTFESQQQKKPKRPRKNGSEYPDKEEPRGRKLARLRERVVLYDATIQSINSVKELRGAMRDAKFVEELDGKANHFRALKCLNISYSHTLLGNHLNALALLKRAQNLLASSEPLSSDRATGGPPTLDISSYDSSSLRSHVSALVSRTHALVELHNLEANSASKNSGAGAAPIVQNLHAYPPPGTHVDLRNLVSYPPKLEPVPVKPLFLDVAWNYIEYPGRKPAATFTSNKPVSREVEMSDGEEEQPKQEEKKRGWFGFGR
ncbi:Hypothetical protein R9X50_00069700 [Acrodontium crateriforme]|uniref:Signal recognition particle subunit SRP68 n=1 Tax=Acrodontium crateriforme TaxID=150365 RepID=A0AAQ3R7F2_9PEZI|nr:Hypothetical protein R9X50_00069700 [Acrodontium crateriforme]